MGDLTGAPLSTEDVARVLELAHRTAHETARPLAPLATYALGVAVGRGADPALVTQALEGLGAPTQER